MNEAEVVKLDVGSSLPPAMPAGERLSDEVAILAGRVLPASSVNGVVCGHPA